MSNEEYRNRVQAQLQDLVSGNRPRDPHLSSVSTERLILEGVVEAIRTYRLHKQEQVRKQKGERMSGKERGDGERDEHRNRHRHHDQEENGERCRHGRNHRNHSGERHRRHRSRDRSHDDTPRRVRTKGRDRSSEGSRHGHRDHERGKDLGRTRSARGIPDPITEGPPDENPRYMMTGGAGPAGTLPSPDQAPSLARSRPRRRSRSRSRSRPRPAPEHSPSGQTGLSRSPIRICGPDGTTPFGLLPKRSEGEGFAAHAFNVYRHVKAEHEHGHRDRSAIEKAVDRWREMGGTKGRNVEEKKEEKFRKERGRKYGERRGGGGDRRRRENAGKHEGRRRSDERSRGLQPPGTERETTGASSAQHPHNPHTSERVSPGDSAPVQIPRRNASRHLSQESDRRHAPPPPLVHVKNATPPPPPPAPHNKPPEWPPSPEAFVPHRRSVSPPYPDRLQGSPNMVPMPQRSPVLRPPPPSPTSSTTSSFHMPPPPAPAGQAPPSTAALLDQIQIGRRLRRVASADRKDKSQAAWAGRVYDETAHSREVEERERAQEGGWSDDGGSETESERMRKLRLELGGVR